MAARTCAKRAHQLAASILSNGVGPSRLPAATACRCQLHTITAVPATSRFRSARRFSISAHVHEEEWTKSPQNEENRHSQTDTRGAEKKVALITEDVADAEPTLEYLDSLKPRPKRFQREERRSNRSSFSPFSKPSSNTDPEDKQWERTRSRINASFTRDQLATLARSGKLPGSYSKKVRKDELVRRIMVHRFGMEDARERADRERREELQKRTVHLSFRPAEMYLLLSRGSSKVRQEAGKAQVAILPRVPKEAVDVGNDQLGFWIKGKDQGIAQMTKWVENFKQEIKTRKEEVVLSAGDKDAAAGDVLPAELVRFISQVSRCFMEASPIQNGKVTLSLAYLNERDADKAVLLLRQYQAETAEALHRISAAAHCDNVDILRQYSMLPFVPNEPTSWIKKADDLLYGTNSDVYFRVTHLPDFNAFSLRSPSKLPTMKLNGWTHQGALQFDQPFQTLLDAAATSASQGHLAASAAINNEVECSATLGHVLFSSGGLALADEKLSEEEVLAQMQDPLAAPRPGIWPIEHVLDWARDFRTRFGREASRFVPTTLFRSQKNVSLDIWLDRQGYALLGKGTPEAVSEQTTLVYQPAETGYSGQGCKLEIVLKRQQSVSDAAEGSNGGWKIKGASWVAKVEGDVMIPEKSADLRLCAKTISSLEGEVLEKLEEALAEYLDTKPAVAKVAEAALKPEAHAAAADTEAAVEGVEGVEGETAEADLLGGEVEVLDRSNPEAVETAAPVRTGKSLPPSLLNVASIGLLALESATRMTVQTYQQRSNSGAQASPPFQPLTTTSDAEAATSEEVLVESVQSTEGSDPSTDASAESVETASESETSPITTAEVAAEEATRAEEDPTVIAPVAESASEPTPPAAAGGGAAESESAAESETADPDKWSTNTEVPPAKEQLTSDAPAEPAQSEAAGADASDEFHPSSSTRLVREISQDLVTKATTESLRITWRHPSPSPLSQQEEDSLEWNKVVEQVSALVERYDASIR